MYDIPSDFAAANAEPVRSLELTPFYDDDDDEEVASQSRAKKRKKRGGRRRIVDPREQFSRFQNHDEKDNIFSEFCVNTLDAHDLVPRDNYSVKRIRYSNVGDNTQSVSLLRECDLSSEDEGELSSRADDAEMVNKFHSNDTAVRDVDYLHPLNVEEGCVSRTSDSKLVEERNRSFAALWYQLTRGSEKFNDIVSCENRLKERRRDALAVACSFRFSATKPFRTNVIDACRAYDEKMSVLLEYLHVSICKRDTHQDCDMEWPNEITVTSGYEIIHNVLASVMKFATIEREPTEPLNRAAIMQAETVRSAAKQIWAVVKNCWYCELNLSGRIFAYTRDIYPRLAKNVKQIQRVPDLPINFLHAQTIQLYALMFVRTYENVRQLQINLYHMFYEEFFKKVLRSSPNEDDENDQADGRVDSVDLGTIYNEPHFAHSSVDEETQKEHERMDRYVESDEDNSVQKRVREFLLGYAYFIAGDARLLAGKASVVNLDLLTETDCKELVALNETVLCIFLALRMIYFDQHTARLERFVRSVEREFATCIASRKQRPDQTSHTWRIRSRALLRTDLENAAAKSVSETYPNRINILEIEFLNRWLRETITAGPAEQSSSFAQPTVNKTPCDQRKSSRQKMPPLDADTLMRQIERDVLKLNDQNFQLNERNWSDCNGWIFASYDKYKFTYPYALLNNVSNIDRLRDVRKNISLYNQLLRLKFYRMVFVREKNHEHQRSATHEPTGTPSQQRSEPEDDGQAYRNAQRNLSEIYQTLSNDLLVRESRERNVRSSLDQISELVRSTERRRQQQ